MNEVAAQSGTALTTLEALRVYPREMLDEIGRAAVVRGRGLRSALAQGRRLTVAAIADDSTRAGLHAVCDLIDLHPATWRQELGESRPDLLFVESAWSGHPVSRNSRVEGWTPEIQRVVAWCRQGAVPTVFWDNGDPVNWRTFLRVAQEFDFLFTTDSDHIPRYAALCGHDRVSLLPLATAPSLHNAIEERSRKEAAVFAGGYYRRHLQRVRDLEAASAGIREVVPLEIFDPALGTIMEDYAFPSEYADLIVGTLAADEVDYAYKRYRYALNLNSIKDSQTLLARRVFELLSSGTSVVSNYARGLRNLFGELIPMSESAAGFERIMKELRDFPDDAGKRREMGLRKVLSEHTYADRLREVASVVAGVPFELELPLVNVFIAASTAEGVARGLRLAEAQADVRTESVVLASTPEARQAAKAKGVRVLDAAEAETVGEVFSSPAPVSVMDEGDWYGPYYLASLVQATQYSDVGVIGKASYFAAREGWTELADAASEHRLVNTRVPWRQALVLWQACGALPLASVVPTDPVPVPGKTLGVGRWDYCRDGAGLSEAPEHLVAWLPIDVGLPLHELVEAVGAQIPDWGDVDGVRVVSPSVFPRSTPRGRDLSLEATDQGVILAAASTLEAALYLRFAEHLDVGSVWPDGHVTVRLEQDGTLRTDITIIWFDENGERLHADIRVSNTTHHLTVPEGAVTAQLSLRVIGEGRARTGPLYLAEPPKQSFLGARREVLVLTNVYPSYDQLYRNAFVHSRVRAYRARGLVPDVFLLGGNHPTLYREFEGVEIQSGRPNGLHAILDQTPPARIAVHFLTPEVWASLRPFADDLDILVWVHGVEVQPWWRRAFNYATEEELARAKEESEVRVAFWRNLLADLPHRMRFVFVSEYFRREVEQDIGLQFPDSHVSVIHNPIDTAIFDYVPKTAEQRKKVLLVRPFASRKYANDLAVEAIVELSNDPLFSELEFRIVGQGVLFEETVAPLRGFANVIVEERFLQQHDIAQLHKEYGVFLCPTRGDSQGVSRDEAMSSGLVPITSDVAAIPEFVSDREGILAPADDAHGLAEGIRHLYHHPDEFLEMSKAAADRVRSQTASDLVIDDEIALLWGAG